MAKIEVLNNVAQTQELLSLVGIGSLRPWRKDELGFISSTPYYQFGGDSTANGMKNNLAFYLESPVAEEVKAVKLMLNINNAAERQQALDRYTDSASATLSTLNIVLPEGFRDALVNGNAFEYEDDSVIIKNEVYNDRIDWYKLVVLSK